MMPCADNIVCVCAVSAWLSEVDSDNVAAVDSGFDIMKETNNHLSIPQADQLTAQQPDLGKFIPDEDTSITMDLTLDLGSAYGERIVRRGVKLGSSDFSGSVSDLTAEVDFEIGPDVSSESPCTLCSSFLLHFLCMLMRSACAKKITRHGTA